MYENVTYESILERMLDIRQRPLSFRFYILSWILF